MYSRKDKSFWTSSKCPSSKYSFQKINDDAIQEVTNFQCKTEHALLIKSGNNR